MNNQKQHSYQQTIIYISYEVVGEASVEQMSPLRLHSIRLPVFLDLAAHPMPSQPLDMSLK